MDIATASDADTAFFREVAPDECVAVPVAWYEGDREQLDRWIPRSLGHTAGLGD